MDTRARRSLVLLVFLALASCAPEEPPDVGTLPASGVVNANGIDFDYFAEGNGVPCMVVGDALTPSRALSAELRETFQFIFVNSRMTTEEARVGDVSRITMDTLVSDVEGVRQSLGLGPVCVMGHSISGLLALEYGRKHPESTRCVIMHATPPYENQQFRDYRAAYWEEHASAERKRAMDASWARLGADSLSRLTPSEAGKLEYITNAPRYFYDPTYDPTWLLDGAYWNSEAWARMTLAADYDLGEGAPLRVPVFLALGREDYGVPFTLWEREREKIPELSYHLFDRSGHYPMLEESELFNRLLVEWIEGI